MKTDQNIVVKYGFGNHD